MTAIDWLGGSLAALAARRIPDAMRTDDTGSVRIVAAPRTLVSLLREAFEPIAPHAGRNPDVAGRLLDALGRVASAAERPEDRQAIALLARAVWTKAADALPDDPSRSRLAERYADVQRRLEPWATA
jgi:uncharacterized membrane protein